MFFIDRWMKQLEYPRSIIFLKKVLKGSISKKIIQLMMENDHPDILYLKLRIAACHNLPVEYSVQIIENQKQHPVSLSGHLLTDYLLTKSGKEFSNAYFIGKQFQNLNQDIEKVFNCTFLPYDLDNRINYLHYTKEIDLSFEIDKSFIINHTRPSNHSISDLSITNNELSKLVKKGLILSNLELFELYSQSDILRIIDSNLKSNSALDKVISKYSKNRIKIMTSNIVNMSDIRYYNLISLMMEIIKNKLDSLKLKKKPTKISDIAVSLNSGIKKISSKNIILKKKFESKTVNLGDDVFSFTFPDSYHALIDIAEDFSNCFADKKYIDLINLNNHIVVAIYKNGKAHLCLELSSSYCVIEYKGKYNERIVLDENFITIIKSLKL